MVGWLLGWWISRSVDFSDEDLVDDEPAVKGPPVKTVP
jgi:hypothetical protein